MKIVIVGIGGIGGVIGAKLAISASNLKNEVIFFCRGAVLEAVKDKGIELISESSSYKIKPALATDDPKQIGKVDIVFFAVKNYSIEQVAEQISPIIGENTIIIPLLNGIQAVDVLRKKFTADVLGGCIYISSYIVSPGVVKQNGSTLKIVFGNSAISDDANEKKYAPLLDTLNKSGISAVATSRITSEMWAKFIMISSFATVTTLFKRNAGETFANDDSSQMFTELIHEIVKVANAKKVKLPDDIEALTLKKAKTFSTPETKTSMQLDFEKGGKNELEALTGYVCREADILGVSAPLYHEAYKKLLEYKN